MDIESAISIAIAEDHTSVRMGISSLLEASGKIKVVLEASNGVEMIAKLRKQDPHPEILIIDISMPVMDGFELQKEIKRSWPHLRSLVLTAYKGDEAKKRMFKLGANGFLSKDCMPEEIVTAVLAINEKGFYYHSTSDAKLYALVAKESVRVTEYKPRDLEFLKYLWEGLSYQEIALRMKCSESAIRSYRDRLFRKMGVRSKEELLRTAVKSGLFEL